MDVVEIGPEHPEMELFRCRRDYVLAQNSSLIIDSEKVVCRAYQLGVPIKKLLVSDKLFDKHRSLIASQKDQQVFLANTTTMQSIIGHRIHQGMIAIGERPESAELKELTSPLLVLEHLVDPENVGSILRSAAALGFRSVLLSDSCCSPYYRRCVRVSMGAVFTLKIRITSFLLNEVQTLRRMQNFCFVHTSRAGSQGFDVNSLSEKIGLIIGNEDRGVGAKLTSVADFGLRIPMAEGIDSLNAATAGAILMHELRQSTNGFRVNS